MQKDSQIPSQRPCSRMTAQKINKRKTSVAGRLYSCAAQNKTGEGASQGRVLSWHSVSFVPPYRAAESCQPQSSFEPQKKRDCKAYFCFLVEFFLFCLFLKGIFLLLWNVNLHTGMMYWMLKMLSFRLLHKICCSVICRHEYLIQVTVIKWMKGVIVLSA